jgi:hypothetical protein
MVDKKLFKLIHNNDVATKGKTKLDTTEVQAVRLNWNEPLPVGFTLQASFMIDQWLLIELRDLPVQ